MIIIGGLPKLAVTNDDIIGRSDSFRSIASLNLGRRRPIVRARTEINNAANARYSPDIGVEVAGAAWDSRILGIKGFTEAHLAAQLHAAISGDRTWRWRRSPSS